MPKETKVFFFLVSSSLYTQAFYPGPDVKVISVDVEEIRL